MKNVPIEGYDITKATPINSVIHVGGFIRSPNDPISIEWEIDGASGSTQCEAWRGQHEIDCLQLAGAKILSVGV